MQETEVRETTTLNGDSAVERRTIARTEQPPGVVVLQRTVWFIAGVISVIVTMRFVLLLLGANRDAGFTDLVYTLSAPFVAPFVDIFGEPAYGTVVFEVSSLLAIVVYLLIAWGIAKLVTLGRPRDEI